MRTEQGRTLEEEINPGMVPRIVEETDDMVLLGVPMSKQAIKDHLPFIASVIEAAERLIRRQ